MEEIQNILTAKDFKSDQEVRWCPGCGDHAIMNAIQRTLPELGIAKEDFAFISGIGCSSRFPYYMDTFGFHSIHGRASAIASGVKVANPKLSVWQITGDGDAMAIGGNHFIHAIRRNIDVNIILFNNEIYGLTKGQYSPTSKFGYVTKTSPYGTVEHPFHPGELVIGAQGKFFARSIDNNMKLCQEIFIQAARHHGATVVEVLQNCVIYNDKTHAAISDKEHKADRTIVLRHGEPMIFGKNNDKGLILDAEHLKLKIVELGDKYSEKDLLVHNAKEVNPGIHLMLTNMSYPEHPVAFGVIRSVETETYDNAVFKQVEDVKSKSAFKNVDNLLNSGTTWEV
ncbi:MAG: 2-oxoacid:ferredoxin oxidoreductase subunit beta [Bacteroidales bacterium]|jgi:2-oxoglutarate ferredoxin oxidoreductase subunit beta|nr:2-oxoacid:ferredoxin oxidoreductase subunit beta [Bacteroidales bacterium]